MTKSIDYALQLDWTGNTGSGTSSYTSYARDYLVHIEGKPDLAGTADSHFRGDPAVHDPEDHFLAAISGCHMLTYLALAAKHGVVVLSYRDQASGVLDLRADGGRFTSVTLRPTVTITADSDHDRALELHHDAQQNCFIANSCSVPIDHQPTIVVAGG